MTAHEHEHEHGHDHEHPHADDHKHSHPHARPHVHAHSTVALDQVALTHVGFDVGSATVKLMACRLVLAARPAGQLQVAERRVLFRPPAFPTPYRADHEIDVDSLERAVRDAWEGASIPLDAADTRLAVLTGPAAAGPSADPIARTVGERGFGCMRAGPNLSAALAAYGSDAVARSIGPHGEDRTILHVDLGATVTRFALCRGGDVLDTAAINLGPRLVVLDEDARIVRLDPAARVWGDHLGLRLEVGGSLSTANLKTLGDELAECLFSVLERKPHPLAQQLLRTEPLAAAERLNAVSFSGGAAEHIYGGQGAESGDLAPLLGRAVRQRLNRLGVAVQEPEHLIRATLLGCAQYRMEDIHGMPFLAEPAAFDAARERDHLLVA